MPNWCRIKLTITGSRLERDRFVGKMNRNEDNNISFIDALIPMPDGEGDWYNWALNHWGTKWGDCQTRLVDDSDRTVLVFDTAWSPPDEAMHTISTMFPELMFRLAYEENGMCFLGEVVYVDGSIIAQSEANDMNGLYPHVENFDDDSWEELEERLATARTYCHDTVAAQLLVKAILQ